MPTVPCSALVGRSHSSTGARSRALCEEPRRGPLLSRPAPPTCDTTSAGAGSACAGRGRAPWFSLFCRCGAWQLRPVYARRRCTEALFTGSTSKPQRVRARVPMRDYPARGCPYSSILSVIKFGAHGPIQTNRDPIEPACSKHACEDDHSPPIIHQSPGRRRCFKPL